VNDYDQAARFAARRIDPEGMLRWLVGERTWAAWGWTGWLDSQAVPFPGEADRRMDTVATFERPHGDAPPLAVVIEFLTRPAEEVLRRLAEYALRVHREVPYQEADPRVEYSVIGLLVLLTGAMKSGAWSMRPPDVGGLGLSADAGLRTLAREPARDVPAGVEKGAIARAVLAWLPLMDGADDATVIAEWARLATAEPDEVKRASIGGVAKVFARLADREAVWKPVLEGWNVERSPVVLEWEMKGELRASRQKLLRVFQVRLGQEVPPDVQQAVQEQQDLAVLAAWFDQALTVPDMEQARRFLGLANGAARPGG
jgi:hypothetical protein